MASAGAPSLHGLGALEGLEACVRTLDPASRALLDLSLRRRVRDDDMAPVLRIDPFNLAWRRARTIERLASRLGLDDPTGLAQVRAALPFLPDRAWCVPLELEAGPTPAVEEPAAQATESEDPGPETVEGEAITMEFEAVTVDPVPGTVPEHAWGPRTLAPPRAAPGPAALATPAAPAIRPGLRAAVSAARTAVAARPSTARGALLAGAGALVGAMLSRRRRWR